MICVCILFLGKHKRTRIEVCPVTRKKDVSCQCVIKGNVHQRATRPSYLLRGCHSTMTKRTSMIPTNCACSVVVQVQSTILGLRSCDALGPRWWRLWYGSYDCCERIVEQMDHGGGIGYFWAREFVFVSREKKNSVHAFEVVKHTKMQSIESVRTQDTLATLSLATTRLVKTDMYRFSFRVDWKKWFHRSTSTNTRGHEHEHKHPIRLGPSPTQSTLWSILPYQTPNDLK